MFNMECRPTLVDALDVRRASLDWPRVALAMWRVNMRLSFAGIAVGLLLLFGCSSANEDSAGTSSVAIESIHTDLDGGSCRREIDKEDPNDTPYLVCPGVEDYALIVRDVDSGRKSIDIIDPSGQVLPLAFDEVVTRHMSNLDGKAEWRVVTRDGKPVPIALIVRVQAREDDDNPEKITQSYRAVAKLSASQTCVTDRIPEGGQSETEARRAADSAQARPCAPPQPHIIIDGVVIR
jgi:hypothetical protein